MRGSALLKESSVWLKLLFSRKRGVRSAIAVAVAGCLLSLQANGQSTQPPGNTSMTLKFEWRHLGHIEMGSSGKKGLKFPKAPNGPGVYLFEFRVLGMVRRYVGQAKNLRNRFRRYRSPGKSEKQTTTSRIHAWLRFALDNNGVVDVFVVTDDMASICPQSGCGLAKLPDLQQRLLFERLGIFVECKPPVCLNLDQRSLLVPPPP